MSTTLYLRFPDEATFLATLPADFEQQGEAGYPLPEGVEAIRIVGPMYAGDPATLVAGWHVNVLGSLPDAWKPYQIFPVTPMGVFGTK
jgi:hypothetical protein